jgi:DNA-binding LytR/AlgR family response regulator
MNSPTRPGNADKPTALIADDEPVLVEFLDSELAVLWPELKIVAVAYNGVDALRLIDEHAPSIAFLDIRMPGLTGLELATRLTGSSAAPRVVFVTAYDQYAVEAFDREAVDYLLKPPTRERLGRAVDKLKRQLSQPQPASHPADLLERLSAALACGSTPSRLHWITAAHGSETRLISIDEVVFFEANDKYVSVYTETSVSLIRTPLRALMEGLDGSKFWQVHRGTVVAVKHIARTTRDLRNRTFIKLRSRPEELLVSRAFVHLFKQM